MTGVDSDPAKARECRTLLTERYAGYLCCPGHGSQCRLPEMVCSEVKGVGSGSGIL